MDEKSKTKRKEIEELLAAGKTAKEIREYTGYDRTWVWNVEKMWKKEQEAGKKNADI